MPAARLHECRAACCPLYLLLLLVLNLAVAVGGVQLWEILKSGFLRPKKPKKFFISGCGRNVENVEDFFYSTSRLKTLCEMLKICLGFRGKPVSADRRRGSAVADVLDDVADRGLGDGVLFGFLFDLLDRVHDRRVVAAAELLADLDHRHLRDLAHDVH